MSKKKSPSRKPSVTAAIKVVDDNDDFEGESEDNDTSTDVEASSAVAEATPAERRVAKPARAKKPAADAQSSDNISIGEIKKAAAFANSVGGVDKAVALLQILKVAKEVQ